MTAMRERAASAIGYYTTAEVARLAGVSPARIGQWARYGLVPSISANPRVYSYADAGEAVLVHYLVEQGRKTRDVREIVQNLRDRYGAWPIATAPLEHEGSFVVVREGDRLVFSALNAEQGVISGTLLNLQEVRKALQHGGWVALKTPREHVQVDPALHSGQPVVRGRRISTADVADIAGEPGGRQTLLEDYELTDAEIDAALAYEEDVAASLAA